MGLSAAKPSKKKAKKTSAEVLADLSAWAVFFTAIARLAWAVTMLLTLLLAC